MYIVDYCCTLVYSRLIAFAPLDVFFFLATGLWRYCSGCCFEQHRPSFGCGWQLPKAAIRVLPYFRIKLKTTSDVRSWWDDMGSLIHYPHIACILSPKFPHDWAKLSEASAAPSEQRGPLLHPNSAQRTKLVADRRESCGAATRGRRLSIERNLERGFPFTTMWDMYFHVILLMFFMRSTHTHTDTHTHTHASTLGYNIDIYIYNFIYNMIYIYICIYIYI